MIKKYCNLCPRKCNSERTLLSNVGGVCGMPLEPVLARAGLYFGEEPCISGTNGSGTVFFSGCNLKCVYCQNGEISSGAFGIQVTPHRLAEIFSELEEKDAHNINFVTPSHYIMAIKEALSIYRPKIPLVYNSSSYDFENVIDEDIFDIYLMDLKYVSTDRSQKYSACADYFEVASKTIKAAYNIVGKGIHDSDGIMTKGLIVRHLIMPLATNEALSVIDWFCDNTPAAYFSLMAQYTPCFHSNHYPEINRKITLREYKKTESYLIAKGIKNAYIQDFDSSGEKFIPIFDGFGVLKA